MEGLFLHGRGEFSVFTEIAFTGHLKRLERLKRLFYNANGDRLKLITKQERCWYGARN